LAEIQFAHDLVNAQNSAHGNALYL